VGTRKPVECEPTVDLNPAMLTYCEREKLMM